MAEVSQDDIERLAARVAMLVSDDGEAANAGRAVGQLARRLGLSGGDLKELFLTGSLSGGRKPPEPTVDAQQEIATLKRNLRRLEHVVHNLQEERDRLVAEAGSLRVGMYRARANRKLRLGLIGLGALIVLGGGWAVAYLDFDLAPRTPPRREAPAGLAGVFLDKPARQRCDPAACGDHLEHDVGGFDHLVLLRAAASGQQKLVVDIQSLDLDRVRNQRFI